MCPSNHPELASSPTSTRPRNAVGSPFLPARIDIQLADGSVHRFGPEDLRLWEDLTGKGHRTRFPVPTVTVSMPVVD